MIFYPPPVDKVNAPLRSNPGSATDHLTISTEDLGMCPRLDLFYESDASCDLVYCQEEQYRPKGTCSSNR